MIYSLTSNVRITKANEYARIFQNSTHTQSKFWQVVVAPSIGPKPRLGLAISKKTYKKAVDRNLRKRLARETFRLKQAQLRNLDIVVMAKKSHNANNKSLIADLSNLFNNTSKA